MDDDAVAILDENRTMAISTVRPDGWPQTTIVGYANDRLSLYFLIFRSSQKFANISADDRVALAIGGEPRDLREARAVFAGAFAAEVTDAAERAHAWQVLGLRHPALRGRALPDFSRTALMRADCRHVSVLDYRKGLGHRDALHVAVEPGDESAGEDEQ